VRLIFFRSLQHGSTAMSNIRDATQQSTPRTKLNPVKRCPHCASVWLTQLFIGRERDWYRCQQCGDTFAIAIDRQTLPGRVV
jgi:transposase-like protein